MPNPVPMKGDQPIVLAYSGGLDTSFLVPWLKENYGRPVITVTVDTGGIDEAAARTLAERARALGAVAHHQIDARADYFEQVLRFLIMGNVKRGQMYPLCVGAERVMQAQTIAHMARRLGTNIIAHGCTAAGNDQVRFEVAMRTLAPELEVLAPVRDRAFKRQEELEYLQSRGLPVPPYRCGLFRQPRPLGCHDRRQGDADIVGSIPDHAWVLTRDAFTQPRPRRVAPSSSSNRGGPRLDGRALSPVALLEALEALAAPFGIGRGIHLGDTIIGTKGRVAFEAPAAEVLLTAHRELEKLVLTGRQQRIKETVAQPYGDLVHEGQLLDPVCRDIEALLLSSQERVSGHVRVQFRPGNLFVEGVESPYSLMAASKGVYGEAAGEWTPSDALGFSKIVALTGVSHRRAGERAKDSDMVSGMRSVVVDKIASVAQACGLSHEVRISTEIPSEEGVVIVVEVLTNKSTYNTLELTSGRMAKVGKGDIVVGALGHRKALFGYSGHVPPALQAGDVIQMLNIGGVLGICDSINPDKGKPFDCRVIGVALNSPISASASACRRAPVFVGSISRPSSMPDRCRWWRWQAPAWKRARPPRRARSSAACATAAWSSTPSRLPACRCVVTFTRWRMPARVAPPSSPTWASSRPPGKRPGAHTHHADGAGGRQARRDRVRARRRHSRHIRCRCHPGMPRHSRRAHRRRALGQ